MAVDSRLPAQALLRQFQDALDALEARELIRTRNVLGDVAEAAVRASYGGALATNSNAAWDIETDDGRRIQVKARALRPGKSQAVIFKSWDFDIAVVMGFDRSSYEVVWAREITSTECQELARGGLRFSARAAAAAGLDVTVKVREGYASL